MAACEHKISTCVCPYERWREYRNQVWQPWLIALIGSTSTQGAADMLEASLILHFEHTTVNQAYNYNWTTSCTYGGEGPRSEAHEYFIYIALKPLKPPEGRFVAAASANYGEMYRDVSSDEQEFPPPYLARSYHGLVGPDSDYLLPDLA